MEQEEPATNRYSVWCLCWQAAVGREFFPVPALRSRIRDRVVEAHHSRARVLIDFCLLPTEIHLVSQLGDGDEPRDLARAIGSVIARWIREIQPIRSPLMAGPYHAHQIESEEELRREARMLAWRPVALGLRRGPTYHRDTALRVALGRRPADGFDPWPLLGMFGTTLSDARIGLRQWVSQRPSEADWLAWELARGFRLAVSRVGPRPLAAREVRNVGAIALIAAGAEGVDGALRLLVEWVTAKLGGSSVVDLHMGMDPVAARGRALVARLAMEHALCSSASVARYFGRAKATLSEQMSASRLRAGDVGIVLTPVHRILSEVAALHPGGGSLDVSGPERTGMAPE